MSQAMIQALPLKACHCCGQIHKLPILSPREVACCTRCGATIARIGSYSASRTAAAAMAAFILYWPAMLLPILEIEQLGHRHESSLLFGTLELLVQGSWFVGSVILIFSVLFPLVKILLLLELSLLGILHSHHKAATYRIMEYAGKWSMMDVMLLALLVMLVKLGELVEFHVGPAIWAFVFCVAMSMLASISFDPHSIWKTQHE